MAEYVDIAIARLGMAMVMADGEVNQDELDSFLEEMSDFDVSVEAVEEVIGTINDEDFFEKAAGDVLVIAEHGAEGLKEALWSMAVKLMIADGDLDENELMLTAAMGEAWGLLEDE